MKPYVIDGITIDSDYAKGIRQSMIELRNAALDSGNMQYSFNISIVIAILAAYIEQLEKQNAKCS